MYYLMFFLILLQNDKQSNIQQPQSSIYSLPRKPYIQNITPTEVSLLWETKFKETNVAVLTKKNSDLNWKLISNNTKYHEVRFNGLVPNTRYIYKIKTSSGIWSGTLKTAILDDTPFSFLILGDNRHGHSYHRALIERMALESADFYINTGDMVNSGLKKKNWYRFFKIEYPLLKKIPLFPAVGNHENAFGKGAIYYRRYFAVPKNGPQKEMTYFFTWGNSRFFFLNTNTPFIGAEQTLWIKNQLTKTTMNNRIKHIFIVVHQSPYTSGPHGPNLELLNSGLVEIFKKYGVDMLIAGHDHIYERGRVQGLNYIISGGGGAPIYYVKNNKSNSLVSEPTYHYCKIIVRGDTLDFSAMRMDGSLLDYMVLKKRNIGKKNKIKIIGEFKSNKSETTKSNISQQNLATNKRIKQPNAQQKHKNNIPYYVFLLIIGLIVGLSINFVIKKIKIK